MSKLSFRSRALDASRPILIYRDTEITELADCASISRTVPQMPTGMEKEEESEHHLQQAICTGTTIPTPEVYTIEDLSVYNSMYPADYKTPRQLIYMQPFSMEADIPDYDMDSEDENWVNGQAVKLDLTADKFEEMMDRLEKGSGQTVVTLQEAKALIKEDDDLIIAVYDYWLSKRLNTQHHLIPQVRTEARHGVSNHNPYIAFRRRTEKMQTRKNRKNDESSYEKMLKLKRDLSRAVTLLEMVKRREKSKRELLHLSIEVFEKRYQAGDYTGQIISETLSQRPSRPAFTPLYQGNNLPWVKDANILNTVGRKEKRHYKKRRHKSSSKALLNVTSGSGSEPTASSQSLDFAEGDQSSDDEVPTPLSDVDEEDEDGAYPFKRRLHCLYNFASDSVRSPPPRCSNVDDGTGDKLDFFPAYANFNGRKYYIGSARRRFGRGGRIVIDRLPPNSNQELRTLGYNIYDSWEKKKTTNEDKDTTTVDVNKSPPRPPVLFNILGKFMSRQNGIVRGHTSSPEHLNRGERPNSRRRTFSTNSTTPRSRISMSSDEQEMEEEGSIPQIGAYLGVLATKEDEPMLFKVKTLLEDPEPHQDTVEPPYFLSGDTDEYPSVASLLDKSSADLVNQFYSNDDSEPLNGDLDWYESHRSMMLSNDNFLSYNNNNSLDTTSSPTSDEVMYISSSSPSDYNNEMPKLERQDILTPPGCPSKSSSSSSPIDPKTGSDLPSTVSLNVVLSPERFRNHNGHNGHPESMKENNSEELIINNRDAGKLRQIEAASAAEAEIYPSSALIRLQPFET